MSLESRPRGAGSRSVRYTFLGSRGAHMSPRYRPPLGVVTLRTSNTFCCTVEGGLEMRPSLAETEAEEDPSPPPPVIQMSGNLHLFTELRLQGFRETSRDRN